MAILKKTPRELNSRLRREPKRNARWATATSPAKRRLATLFVAALSASATASAAHVYGLLYGIIPQNLSGGDAGSGSAVYVETDNLDANFLICCCPSFITHEMWYGLSSTASYWVEVGFVDGVKSGGQSGCANDAVFWADNRNGGGYHEHYPNNSWSYGTWYQLWVAYNGAPGGCAWSVNVGSTNLGTSTNNCPLGTTRALEFGIETPTQTANNQAKGMGWDWARADTAGNWWSGWGTTAFSNSNYPTMRFDPNYPNTVTDEVDNESF
jgi:hypothetical protein